ncbi:MAG: signal peptidase I [Spirochaetaceae bacterium]|jgi:signal peptidase I|nr:signal peptidase I [Spirochaetaceae bacterium]
MIHTEKEKTGFFDRIQQITEAYLTHRARVSRIKKEKQKKKNPLQDWGEAFIWAACVVLLINQYFFQAYQIPSGSMIDTLLIGDRIFVNKMVYGPEILPGVGKISSPIKPQRNDVIIFENPNYRSRGTAFDVAQRILYMLTLSLVDIDKDENGNPKAHFLIKRAVGMPGDRFFNKNGNMYIQFAGEDRIVAETDYNAARKWNHNLTRLAPPESYPELEAASKAMEYFYLNLTPSEGLLDEARKFSSVPVEDSITSETIRLELDRAAFPHEGRISIDYSKRVLGRYVPEGRILPLGDNRDRSLDGRYFGPVRISKVLGKGAFKYWPLNRMGLIK